MLRTLLFLFLCSNCFGRIGETTAELVKRFGPPKFSSPEIAYAESRSFTIGTRMEFHDDEWRITCVIIEERCARIYYSKSGSWSDEQVASVLNANAQGSTWTLSPKDRDILAKKAWRRTDGAIAQLGGQITITAPSYGRAVKIGEAKAKAESRQMPKKI